MSKRPDQRYFRRDQSHQQSHAQPEAMNLGPIAAHPLAGSEEPVLVSTDAQLAEMIAQLAAAGSFAFDSEFIGERSYRPCLCLAQAATAASVFVVDPLAGLDMSGLWELIVEPGVEKIVVAGQQDLAPAVWLTGRAPANVFDAQIAAGFVHADWPLSLSRLLVEFVGISLSLGKGLTFTHWDNRPLSEAQIRYAADDVRYLPAARAAIGARLAELGRTAWAREECSAVLEDMSFYNPAPESLYLRVRGRDRLGRRQLAVLRELAIVRDQAAREQDSPTRTLLNDGVLCAMARRPARELADLDSVRGLPMPVEHRYGPRIIEAAARAMALPEDQLPPWILNVKFAAADRVDKLLADIIAFCRERSIAPSLVTSRKDVACACRRARAGQPPQQCRLHSGWRKELLGDLLSQLP